MHEYETKILSFLKNGKEATLDDLEKGTSLGRDQILWALENLSAAGAVSAAKESQKSALLTDEGKADIGEFPEEALVREFGKTGRLQLKEIKDQIGLIWAKKNGWVTVEKEHAQITESGRSIADGRTEYGARALLKRLASSGKSLEDALSKEKAAVDALVKRGLVEIRERKAIRQVSITKTGAEMLERAPKEKGIVTLTREIIKSKSWEKEGFKPYNVSAPGERAYPGRMHLIREFTNLVRQKWLEMGFIEMSGPIVDSAFWNFDALFSPQDHPTREMQDTYFLRNPKQLSIEDMEALENVRKMHTSGWKERWNEEIAKGAVLRTHTTSVSAHYMRMLATAVNASYPLKFFAVGPVFRNESIDYKHLAQLHQYEGIIVGDKLTFANLIDALRRFYAKFGMDNIRIAPSYFPFTEPSLEISYYDEEHGDTIELGGGGMIRQEITKALGIDRTVLAWGCGLERLLLSQKIFGLDSIITPYRNRIDWLRERGNLKV